MLAQDLGLRDSALKNRLQQLDEINPMLGHRGCRIGVTAPEIYQTQVRAIMEAADLKNIVVIPEIMFHL